DVAFKIVAGIGRDADTCVPPYGKGCVVARRAMHFVPHADLRVDVPLRAACDGVSCADTDTCADGVCVGAGVDPGTCNTPGGCGEASLGSSGGAGDGGGPPQVDGGPSAPDGSPPPPPLDGWHDITDASNWASFDLYPLSARWEGFEGAVFD